MTEGIERLLYRGGFVVHETRAPLQPRTDDLGRVLAGWDTQVVGRYTLRFDETYACAAVAVGDDTEVALLGMATDVERPRLREPAIAEDLAAALARSLEAFYERLDVLGGAHVVVVRTGDRHLLLQDATGMESVAYDVTGDVRLAGSHASLLAELSGYEVSAFARGWAVNPARLLGGEYFPGLLTPYDELRLLTPNTHLDLDRLAIERFYPRKPLGERDLDEILDSSARWLRNQWQWLRDHHDVTMSLTAGLDSRLTLTAARDVIEDVGTFTYTVWGNAVHGKDVEVASALAARLGVGHDVYRIEHVPEPADMIALWQRMNGGMGAGLNLVNAYRVRFPSGHVHVRSNVLETVRGFYLKNRVNHPDRFDANKLSRLFRRATADEFVGAFDDFATVTGFTQEAKLDFHFTDLYYWEHRLGAWHSGIVRRSKMVHNTFVLYNSRRFLETMLARPLDERVAALHVWELMYRLWPEAMEDPIIFRQEPLPRPRREDFADVPLRDRLRMPRGRG